MTRLSKWLASLRQVSSKGVGASERLNSLAPGRPLSMNRTTIVPTRKRGKARPLARDSSESLPLREKPRSSRRESSDDQRTEENRGASSRARLSAERRGLDSGSLSSEPSHDQVEWPSAGTFWQLIEPRRIRRRHRERRSRRDGGLRPKRRRHWHASPTSGRSRSGWPGRRWRSSSFVSGWLVAPSPGRGDAIPTRLRS